MSMAQYAMIQELKARVEKLEKVVAEAQKQYADSLLLASKPKTLTLPGKDKAA